MWIILALLVLLVVAGVVVLPNLLNRGQAVATEPVNEVAISNETGGADSGAASAGLLAPAFSDANDRLLVWLGNGAGPGDHSASEPGQLAFMDGLGAVTPLMDIPPQTTRVQPCSDAATSPDGQLFAFFVGLDAGTLYVMRGSDAPTALDDLSWLSCVGSGTFQYAPNSGRLAYIAYEPDAAQSEFADGFMHVVNTSDLTDIYTYENVTAFDISNDVVAFVSFFTNDKSEADEAAVIIWDGSAERELATLNPTSDECRFTSGQVEIAPDGKLILVLGQRCTSGDTRTSWQLYTVDPGTRSATLAASDFQDGLFASFARTNNLFLSPDGARAYFTIPDGIAAATVGIQAVGLSDMALTEVLDRQGTMATFSGAPNAFPRISPDGRWLAVVVTSLSNENALHIWNLTDPSIAPIIVEAGSSGDTVSSMTFTPDSNRVIAVTGGDNTANNSLIAIDLSSGSDFRISRGRFGRGLTISPNGSEVAIIDWQVLEDPREPPYANTIIVGVDSSAATTLFTGAEIIDGKVENQRFAAPLTWVRVGG
jgi:WD40 repeat protein